MNWIIPDKFLAFSGPSPTPKDPDGWRVYTPEDYIPYFKKSNIDLVIRLNKKRYDKKRFTNHSIKHVDLYYIDGSTPKQVNPHYHQPNITSQSLTISYKNANQAKMQSQFIAKQVLEELVP
jgi:hypothetical protein